MGRLKLLETDSPLDVRRKSPAVTPKATPETPAARATATRRAPRRRREGSTPPGEEARTAAVQEPRTPSGKHAKAPAVQLIGGPRYDLPVIFLAAIWDGLGYTVDELADRGHRISRNALAVAVLHRGMPPDPDAARELTRRWRVLRASNEWPYGDGPSVERKLRVYEAQRAALDEHARGLRARGLSQGRSLLVNAILHFHAPRDCDDALSTVRAFEQLLAST